MTPNSRFITTTLILSLGLLGGLTTTSAAKTSRHQMAPKHLKAMLAWAKTNAVTPQVDFKTAVRVSKGSAQLIRVGTSRCSRTTSDLCMDGHPVIDKVSVIVVSNSRVVTKYYRPIRGMMRLEGFWLEGHSHRGGTDVMGYLSDDGRRWHVGARTTMTPRAGAARAKIRPIDLEAFVASFESAGLDELFDSVQGPRFQQLSGDAMEALLDASFGAQFQTGVDVGGANDIGDAGRETAGAYQRLIDALNNGGSQDREGAKETGKKVSDAVEKVGKNGKKGFFKWLFGRLTAKRAVRAVSDYVVIYDEETIREILGM